ncbi:MAG: hypothetical protein JWL75_168 [Parcubacteria group bacterium]|nr:hypothetical protein [Parcubacteria group bacterium]
MPNYVLNLMLHSMIAMAGVTGLQLAWHLVRYCISLVTEHEYFNIRVAQWFFLCVGIVAIIFFAINHFVYEVQFGSDREIILHWLGTMLALVLANILLYITVTRSRE